MAFIHKEIRIEGYSIGGIETSFFLPHYKIAFDFGRGSEKLIEVPRVFLSHGHLDHASGMFYYFSQRALKNLSAGEVFVPEKIAKPLKKIYSIWQKIEGFTGKGEIYPVSNNQIIPVNDTHFIRAIRSYHRVPSLGYVLYRKSNKLKPQYAALSGFKIKKLKEKGEPIFEVMDIPLVAFSGDTSIEFLEKNPDVQNAKVLIFETTYIDDKRTIERAKKWGHTHLDELLSRMHLLNNEKIILNHLSNRYHEKYFMRIVPEKIPEEQRDRFLIWQKDRAYML